MNAERLLANSSTKQTNMFSISSLPTIYDYDVFTTNATVSPHHNNNDTDFSIQDPFSRTMQYTIGFIMIFFIMVGLLSSIAVARIVFDNKSHLNCSTAFIPVLDILGFIVSAFIMPLNAVSAFSSFDLSSVGCQWYGFAITWAGFMFITLFTVMVIQMYRIIVVESAPRTKFDQKSFSRILIGCITACGLLAAGPLFGMTEYKTGLKPSLCDMRWRNLNTVEIAYLLFLIMTFFVVPAIVVTVLYRLIYIRTKLSSSRMTTRNEERLVYMLKTFVILTCLFVLGWCPYTVCSIIDMTGVVYSHHQQMIYLLSAIFAKMSLTWFPAIILLRHSQYRKQFEEMVTSIAERFTLSSEDYRLNAIPLVEYRNDSPVVLLRYSKIETYD